MILHEWHGRLVERGYEAGGWKEYRPSFANMFVLMWVRWALDVLECKTLFVMPRWPS